MCQWNEVVVVCFESMLSTRISSEEYSIFSSILFYSGSQLVGCVLVCLFMFVCGYFLWCFFQRFLVPCIFFPLLVMLPWFASLFSATVCQSTSILCQYSLNLSSEWNICQRHSTTFCQLPCATTFCARCPSSVAMFFLVSWYRSYSAFVKLQWFTKKHLKCIHFYSFSPERNKSRWSMARVKTRLLFYASHKCEAAFFLCPRLTSSLSARDSDAIYNCLTIMTSDPAAFYTSVCLGGNLQPSIFLWRKTIKINKWCQLTPGQGPCLYCLSQPSWDTSCSKLWSPTTTCPSPRANQHLSYWALPYLLCSFLYFVLRPWQCPTCCTVLCVSKQQELTDHSCGSAF